MTKPTAEVPATDLKPRGLAVLTAAFRERRTLAMLLLGFSAGLPFAMLIGTLNAWLTEAGVSIATIGILSWIGLFGAFRFRWSPVVAWTPPIIGKRFGRRRSWLLCLQVIIGVALGLVALSRPESGVLGPLALGAALGAFAFATQDIVIDAWRIEVADETTPIDLLSTIYQLGYRTAALAGGAGALLLAEAMGCVGLRCEREEDVVDVINQARAINDRPVVIDFIVGADAQVWPMVAAGTGNDEIMAARNIRPLFDDNEEGRA